MDQVGVSSEPAYLRHTIVQKWMVKMKKSILRFILVALTMVMITACAPGDVTQINIPAVNIQLNTPGINPLANINDVNGRVAGALMGAWHGIISPVTLILSMVNPEIQMYEVHNDGSQYNLGFFLGIALVFVILGAFFGSRYH
jgi:hypothetical protein